MSQIKISGGIIYRTFEHAVSMAGGEWGQITVFNVAVSGYRPIALMGTYSSDGACALNAIFVDTNPNSATVKVNGYNAYSGAINSTISLMVAYIPINS